MGYFNNATQLKLPLYEFYGNFSDAYPDNIQTVKISNTKIMGIGQYDLYLAYLVKEKNSH